jgi:DNA ligase-1
LSRTGSKRAQDDTLDSSSLSSASNERRIVTIAKIGTGLSDEQFGEMRKRLEAVVAMNKPVSYEVPVGLEPDVWAEPEVIVEVAADEITRSPTHTAGVALRFPRLVRFRDDKDLAGVTTLEELKSIGMG